MTGLYKAVRPDGTDFYSGRVRWLPEDLTVPDGGWLVEHPHPAAKIGPKSGADASEYLSLSTIPTDCTGMHWPCLLLAVEPVGKHHADARLPNKRRVKAARVVEVLDPHEAFGPQGVHVAALIEQARALTADRALALAAARDAAWDAAWAAARGLVVRDLIATAHYDALTLPWRQVVGRIHPDDPEVAR